MRANAFFLAFAVLLSGVTAARSAPSGNGAMDGMTMDDMPGMPAKKPAAKKAMPKKLVPAQAMPGMAANPAPVPQSMPAMVMPQQDKPAPSHDMAAMAHDMPGMQHAMAMHGLLGGYGMSREASGTSWQPQSAPHNAIHLMADDWMVMLHGRINGIADWQSGPRGDDKVFSTSMAMVMATKDLANGDALGLKAMLSGDALMGRRGYPLLLASGETADGTTHLVDRQHPHDLLGEMAASYSHPLSRRPACFCMAAIRASRRWGQPPICTASRPRIIP
jgi:hypothetical protein